jgi:serine/threonine protein kinase
VALKLVHQGLDSQRVLARFDLERRSLGRMDHPGIARVLDAGSDESGRPYFVMEHVAGEPLTDFARSHGLGTRARLDLLLRVCSAVHHAHQRGILHRDLKPSNILVALHDGVPTPKIIDFGIAKALDDSTDPPASADDDGMVVARRTT